MELLDGFKTLLEIPNHYIEFTFYEKIAQSLHKYLANSGKGKFFKIAILKTNDETQKNEKY